MPIAVVVSCLFYGAITGSGPATVAAIGTMTIPLLVSLGYEKSFVTALVAVAGGLGVIIPPSIPFVIYGQTANVSVASLFTGGTSIASVMARTRRSWKRRTRCSGRRAFGMCLRRASGRC